MACPLRIRELVNRMTVDDHASVVDLIESDKQLRRVVFPDPDAPITARNSPCGTVRSSPLSARTSPRLTGRPCGPPRLRGWTLA
jgi:hypothetical protein